MSSELDRRLRDALSAEQATSIVTPPDGLEHVRAQGQHRLVVRRAWAGVGVAALIGVVFVGVFLGVVRHDQPRSQPVSPAVPGLTGLYSRDVPAAQAKGTGVAAGHWSIEFSADGSLRVVPPTTFRGVLSGTTFESTQNTMRTSLFVQDLCSDQPIGDYTWRRTSDALIFGRSGDSCSARQSLLLGGSWQVGP